MAVHGKKRYENCHQVCGMYSKGISLYTVTKILQLMARQAIVLIVVSKLNL